MSVAIVVTHAAAGLLVVSGITKLSRPLSVVPTLRALGLPSSRLVGGALGTAEIAVGAAVIVAGGVGTAVAVSAAYALFAGVVVVIRRRDSTTPCGCFGATAPPGAVHVVVNTAAAGSAAIASTGEFRSVLGVVADQPLAGVPYLALIGIATYCLYALLSVRPALVREFSLR